MKQPLFRCLALLLAIALTACLLPTAALAGGDPPEETVYNVYLYVSVPIAGEHPSLTGLPEYDSEPYTVDEVHFIELDAEGNPMGEFLTEQDTFIANREYACQVLVTLKAGCVFWEGFAYGTINCHEAEAQRLSDVTALLSCHFVCAPGTVTVSFDANGSPDPAPAPLKVPMGGTIWDAIRNFDAVRMPDRPYEQFWDWSLSPFGNSDGGYFPFDEAVTADLTLYAMWEPCPESVELYVSLPETCLVDNQHGPQLSVPEGARYDVDSEEFFLGLVDGHLHSDLVYTGPLQKGVTYYSRAAVYVDVAGKLPQIRLHGAELISVEEHDSGTLMVLFSVTIPAGDSLKEARAFIQTPRAGTSAFPQIINMTPGVSMGVQGWYSDPEAGALHEGALEGGKTYYAKISVYDGTGIYIVNPQTLRFTVEGKNAKLVKLSYNPATDAPNSAAAIVAVTIPRTWELVVDAPYGGGRFRSDRDPGQWVTVMDFAAVEEGPITLEAKPDPEHLFKMWYDAKTFERLSKDAVYSFQLDRDVHVRAEFVERLPFEDVGAWDYFYEPVQWAIHHDPVITGGKDDTHFVPKDPCTREQIVTFLWKTLGAPEPETATNPFRDVKPGKYYYKAVLWANENGITGGVGDGKFGVGRTCTREQAVSFLWKAAGSPEPESTELSFTDVKPGKYYCKAIAWAVENGVTTGSGGGKFGVGKTCTRAQIITFLYKAFGPKG